MVYFLALAIVSILAVARGASSSDPRSLHARYLDPSEYPPQCQTICLPIINAVNTCAFPSCICTTSNAHSAEACGDCVLEAIPLASEVARVQYIFNYFTDYCLAAGIPLTPLSISVSASATDFIVTASPTVTGAASTSAAGGSGTVTVTDGSSSPKGAATGILKNATSRVGMEKPWFACAGLLVAAIMVLL